MKKRLFISCRYDRVTLFCCSPVEMFLARYCFFLGMADYAVLVLGRGVDCVKSEVRAFGGVDHVMSSARRDDNALAVFDAVFYAVNDHLSFPRFKSEELIPIRMCFFAYFFSRPKAHENELTVLGRV